MEKDSKNISPRVNGMTNETKKFCTTSLNRKTSFRFKIGKENGLYLLCNKHIIIKRNSRLQKIIKQRLKFDFDVQCLQYNCIDFILFCCKTIKNVSKESKNSKQYITMKRLKEDLDLSLIFLKKYV